MVKTIEIKDERSEGEPVDQLGELKIIVGHVFSKIKKEYFLFLLSTILKKNYWFK